jgi:SAM-dependent methyltransferase
MITRIQKAAEWRMRGMAADVRLADYQPFFLPTATQWTDGYRDGGWDYLGDLVERPRYSVILGYLDVLGGWPSILDVGCGAGLMRERIGDRPFSSYVGIDIAEDAIRAADALADDSTSFVHGDLVDTEVAEPGAFDIAICEEVLYCASDPGALLRRVHELVRPGGHLLTSSMRHWGDLALQRMIEERFDLVDSVDVRNRGSRARRRGWRITCHRRR